MGALDDLLLSQQPAYSGDVASLFPQPAPAGPLETFDTGAPGGPQAAPMPFDFVPQDQLLNFAGTQQPLPPKPGEPTVEQATRGLQQAGSIFNQGQPLSGGLPPAQATPFSSYPITETFRETPGEYGVDLGMPVGTPIRAPWGGTISWEQSGKTNWGNRIFVKGANGWTFAVGHLTRFAVPNGATVRPGQVIGYSGGALNDPNSGNSTGPHIEPQLISPLGYYIDPLPWLRQTWGMSGRSQDEIAGVPTQPQPQPQAKKAAPRQPAIQPVLDPRAQLLAAQQAQQVHGGHAGVTGANPATVTPNGNPLEILGGRSLGDILGAPSAVASGIAHGLRPASEGGLPGPIGDIARQIGTFHTDPNDPAVARFYQQNAAPNWPAFQELNDEQRAQVAQGYTEEMIRRFADFNPLDVIGTAINETPAAQEMLYDIGEGQQRFGDFAQATPEQKQQAMSEAMDLLNFVGAKFGTPEAATAALATAPARAALAERLAAVKAGVQNQVSDVTGINKLAVGENQLSLPGVVTKAPPVPTGAPKFDPATLKAAMPQARPQLAGQAGQLNLGVQLAPKAQAAIDNIFNLAKDFDQPGQGLKETVAALRAGLWGGKVNEAHQALSQLATSSAEEQQGVALNAVMRMSDQLARLYDRQNAGEDVADAIRQQETLMAVYSKAARDVVSGWSHELGPTMRNLIDSIMHPYTLKEDALGGTAMPKDPVLAIKYQGGMRNAVFNLGDMVRRYLNKNLKTKQQWDDLAWEMEQGNRFQNRSLETRAVAPGPAVQRIEPAPGGGLRQVPTGEFQPQRIIPPDIKALATLLRAANDAMGLYLTEYRKGAFFQAMRDNFWSRKVVGWRDPMTGKAIYKAELAKFRAGPGRGLQLSPDSPHFQPRTMQEGIDQLERAGWIVLKNPAQNVPEYWNSVAQAVANKNILDILKTSIAVRDGRPVAIEGRAGNPPPEAKGYHHVLPNLDAWVHPDAWKMIESQFDVRAPSKGLEAAHAFGEVFRQVNMINPLVHTINQMSHQLFQTLVPLRLWLMGHQLAKDPGIVREASVYTYIRPRRAATEYSEAMKGITNAGLINPFTERYQQDAADRGWSLAGASGHVALDASLLPLRAAVDAGHTFLFEFVIRNAQMASYVLEKEKLIKMGMDPEQARLIAGIRADRFVGAINPMTKNTWERKWASLTFFAYNWSKTHVMQALESTPALGRRVLAREHPYLSPAATRMLEEEMTWGAFRGITTALFYSNAINYLLAGHPMWENESGRELDWEYTQFARDHLGYTGTTRLYIDAMPMRWINFFFQPLQAYRRRGEDSPGAAIGAGLDWGQTKLMPPLTMILGYMNDDNPAQTAKAITAIESALPLQRQLNAMTGDSIIGPQTIPEMQKAIQDINTGYQPGGTMSLEAQRFLLNASAFAAGENPVKRGPVKLVPSERQKGYAAAQFDRKVALELATNQHVGWSTAGELAKEKAKRAVMDRADGGEAEAQRQEDAFKALQTKAIAEMAAAHNDANLDQVDLSPAAQQKMLANNQNPMDLLDNLEKTELFNKYPQLSLYHQAPDLNPDEQVRAVKDQTAQYHARVAEQGQIARAAQEQQDALLRQGTISFQTWRDQRTQLIRSLYDKNVGSITSLARELPDALTTKEAYDAYQKSQGAPVGTATQRDIAYNGYKAIVLENYTLPDGSLDALSWKADRDKMLSTLPKEEQDYIKLKESSSWTDAEFLYHQLANRYLDFEQQNADAARAYHAMFQVTDTAQARHLYETQHPEIFHYIVARNTFMRQNPLVAEAFAHGSILVKALTTHGVSPRISPSQQIAQLLSRPQPGLDLNRPGGGTTQAQLQQEFAQGYGVPPDQQVPGPNGPSVDLTSLLAALQQPGVGQQFQTPEQKGQLAASLYQ